MRKLSAICISGESGSEASVTSYRDFYPTIRKYVRKAIAIHPENWREGLPSSVRDLDTFTVYRGGGEDIGRAAYSMSWTLSQEMAEWFMKRHELTHPGEQHLYRGTIAADKVIAYIGGRFEFEIVQYRGVKNIEEILYCANEVPMQTADPSRLKERTDHQRKALTELRLLGYMAQLAMEQQCILPKQYEQITKKIYDCRNMLGAWMNSDRRRFGTVK